MYEVKFNQIVKDHDDLSCPNSLYLAELERALAFASLLQKISTPEVKFDGICIEPAKFINHETEKK